MFNHKEIIRRLPLVSTLAFVLGLAACQTVDETPSVSDSSQKNATGSFAWHDLITHDLQQAKQFYAGLFNWTFEAAGDRGGNQYSLAKIEDRYSVGLLEVERPADGSNYTRWLGYMVVNNIDQAVKVTGDSGGAQASSAVERNDIGRAVAIQDPEQAVLGLVESDFDMSGVVLREAPGAVVWNELLSNDPGAAAAFYTALADVSAETLQRRGGDYTILQANGKQAAGILSNPFESAGPLWLTYIAVRDPAAIVARVESLGGKVLLPPSPEVREGSMALIQDPGGAILALQKWPAGQRG